MTEAAATGALLQQRAATDCEARLRRVLAALFELHDAPAAEGALISALSEARDARTLCAAVRLDGLAEGLTLVGNVLQQASEHRRPVEAETVTLLLHAAGQLRADAAQVGAGLVPGRLDPRVLDELVAAGPPSSARQRNPGRALTPVAPASSNGSSRSGHDDGFDPAAVLSEVRAARAAIDVVKADLARHIETLAELQTALAREESERGDGD